MIPALLQSLAATVRNLVRTGKAVHVNESTAQELDLLAGLPWEHAGDGGIPCALKTAKIAERCHWCRTRNRVTPADLALGWLLASKCEAHKNGALTIPNLRITDAEWVTRAAECAELAVTCAWYPFMPPGVERVKDTEDGAGLWIGIPMVTNPVAGSREGARAAWGFVAKQLTRSADDIKKNMHRPHANIDRCARRLNRVADRYRRELEAM